MLPKADRKFKSLTRTSAALFGLLVLIATLSANHNLPTSGNLLFGLIILGLLAGSNFIMFYSILQSSAKAQGHTTSSHLFQIIKKAFVFIIFPCTIIFAILMLCAWSQGALDKFL